MHHALSSLFPSLHLPVPCLSCNSLPINQLSRHQNIFLHPGE
jgi:hypothetical protein